MNRQTFNKIIYLFLFLISAMAIGMMSSQTGSLYREGHISFLAMTIYHIGAILIFVLTMYIINLKSKNENIKLLLENTKKELFKMKSAGHEKDEQ